MEKDSAKYDDGINLPKRARRFKEVLSSQSSLFKEITAEREEILKHKWVLSERAGYDIGLSHAVSDWVTYHRREWIKNWRKANLNKN